SIVDEARAVTGARYAALGIGVDPNRQFHPWVFSGIDRETADRIGRYPRPVGMLGAVLDVERPIRMPDLTKDPRAVGFPPGHPEMRSFLGMPIRYRGASIGHLYLTEKRDADEFTAEDVEAVEVLAAQAAIAYEHARLYERVDEERRRLKAVLEGSPLAVLYIEKESQLVYANPTAQAFFGVAENEPSRESYLGKLGRADGSVLTLEGLPSTRALGGETVLGFDAVVHRPNGAEVPVLINAAPVADSHGAVLGAVIIFQNLEPLKLERLREEFISVVAHDLRAPIAVISGFAELLERSMRGDSVPDGDRKAIDNIRTSARRLNRMVEDLLDVSRIEARRLRIEPREIEFGDLVREVGERVKALLGDHPLRVVGSDAPLLVSADAARLEQVLTNLLTNAAKYSPDGSPIDLSVERRGDEAVVSVA
ncbi:MAG TPA: histidine kinase dimerization/phospho-acceptor domain-containing protein, partial [Anaeromyxobacteraceae bacterium]|nr:histidine kinase dimerization/phospho-acceptor domain-containing protein [Anaeromyxobacteraceae bacterium]